MDKSNSDKALDDLAAGILTSWQETTKNKAEAYKNLMAIGGKAAEAHELANDDRSYGKWVKALCARSSGLTPKIVKASKWCADNRAKADAVKAWLEAAGKEVGAPLTIYNAHGAWRTAMALKGTEEAIKEADLSTEEVDTMQAKARDREVRAEANRQALVIKVPVELKANPLIADLAAQLQAAIEASAGVSQPEPEAEVEVATTPEPLVIDPRYCRPAYEQACREAPGRLRIADWAVDAKHSWSDAIRRGRTYAELAEATGFSLNALRTEVRDVATLEAEWADAAGDDQSGK